MAKKYIAVCLCVLAVCAVFGLNARTNYEQIKTAFEHVGEHANVIVDDVTIIDCFAFIFEDFRIGQDTQVTYHGYNDNESGIAGVGYIISIYKDSGTHISSNGTIHSGGGGRFFAFQSEDTALRVLNALEPLTWSFDNSTPETFWDKIVSGVTSAVNVVVMILGVIFTLVQTIFVFITDSISTAWSAVEMALYILGFPVAL